MELLMSISINLLRIYGLIRDKIEVMPPNKIRTNNDNLYFRMYLFTYLYMDSPPYCAEYTKSIH